MRCSTCGLASGPITERREFSAPALPVIGHAEHTDAEHASTEHTTAYDASTEHASASEPLWRTRESVELHVLRRDFH